MYLLLLTIPLKSDWYRTVPLLSHCHMLSPTQPPSCSEAEQLCQGVTVSREGHSHWPQCQGVRGQVLTSHLIDTGLCPYCLTVTCYLPHSHPPVQKLSSCVKVSLFPEKDTPIDLNVKAFVGRPGRYVRPYTTV